MNDGLDRTSLLLPGHGFLDVVGGVNQDAAFARLDAGAKITSAMEAFGFAQVQKDFHRDGVDFEAGAGLRVRF